MRADDQEVPVLIKNKNNTLAARAWSTRTKSRPARRLGTRLAADWESGEVRVRVLRDQPGSVHRVPAVWSGTTRGSNLPAFRH